MLLRPRQLQLHFLCNSPPGVSYIPRNKTFTRIYGTVRVISLELLVESIPGQGEGRSHSKVRTYLMCLNASDSMVHSPALLISEIKDVVNLITSFLRVISHWLSTNALVRACRYASSAPATIKNARHLAVARHEADCTERQYYLQ